MSKFIRLYDSKYTPITGDMFTLEAINYSEDPDITCAWSGNTTTSGTCASYISTEKSQELVASFQARGRTMVDNGAEIGSSSRTPDLYPRQFYIKNDQSGSVDSEFTTELSFGDEIVLVDRSDGKTIHSFNVLSTDCANCTDDIVKVESKDILNEDGNWVKYEVDALAKELLIVPTTYPYTPATQTVNNHAIKAVKKSREDTYVDVDIDTIAAYKENPDYRAEMIVLFKEGIYPKGSYTVLKDIVHTGDLNDIVIDASGYTGDEIEVKIEIDSTTVPETFKWRAGEYISSTTPASAYGETQRGLSLQFVPLNLGDGNIKVKWLATTGHSTDTWTFKVYPNNKRIYRNQVKELNKIFKDITY
tara:strand:+ start:4496 stop:5578 length:1083 start_codon:yes stop_codon:yes gene_type:complete